MKIEIITRPAFYICGYAVETTLESNDADMPALYNSFFGTEREHLLLSLPGCKQGYYGLEWYTEGQKSFFYLLGKEAAAGCSAPEGALIKSIPTADFAAAKLPAGAGLTGAWTEFFFAAIPAAGCEPDAGHGLYFEYYPEDIHGGYELWAPVKKRYAAG